MTDDELDDRLRRHYADRLGSAAETAPPFEATLAALKAPHPRGGRARSRVAWLVPATAALALAWLWWPQSTRVDALPAAETLLAELTTSTRWQAPSDRWLDPPARPAYLGLPQLGDGERMLDAPPLP